jgi:hypothetical protein
MVAVFQHWANTAAFLLQHCRHLVAVSAVAALNETVALVSVPTKLNTRIPKPKSGIMHVNRSHVLSCSPHSLQ